MATGLSGLAGAYHPQLAKLRQRLEGLVPERAAAAVKEAVANLSTSPGHVSANASRVMELGSSILKRMRRSSEEVMEAANVEQNRPWPWIGRAGYVKPTLAITAAVGAAYLIGRSHRPASQWAGKERPAPAARRPEGYRADMA
jgi:uncharacterized BrkB/YihY/UPF0761 family membrane protein